MTAHAPDRYRRRSQLYRWHVTHGARFVAVDGVCHVAAYGSGTEESTHATILGLCDLSLSARVGFKGRGAPRWLSASLGGLPDKPNQALARADGCVVASLSHEECLVLDRPGGTTVGFLDAAWQRDRPERTWRLPRSDSHAAFALTGSRAAEVLATLCAVDFRERVFPPGSVAQTSLARANAIVIRADLGDTACFYLLGDTSMAGYHWDCLVDAIARPAGRAVGIEALGRLARPRDDGDIE